MEAGVHDAVRIEVLGHLRAERRGVEVGLGGPKQQSVLAVLVAHAPGVLSADEIAMAIYGDEVPDRGRRRVQTYVSTLRSILGDVIVRSDRGWCIDLELSLIHI